MLGSIERIALAALDRPARSGDWLRLIDGLHEEAGFWWLDSASPDRRRARHSFAGVDPYLWLRAYGDEVEIGVRRGVRAGLAPGFHRLETDPIDCVRSLLPRADSLLYSTRSSGRSGNPRWDAVSGLSAGRQLPFLGGAVGYFGYELASQLESHLVFHTRDALGLPDLSLEFVDRVFAYDHVEERLWILGLGFADGRDASGGRPGERAMARSRELVDELQATVEALLAAPTSPVAGVDASRRPAALAREPRIVSTTDASGYAKAVDTILEEIGEGNVYQANFSQRLSMEAPSDPWPLYLVLRERNPAPFGAYLRLPDAAVLSSSPERFLRLDESRRVESRPIKGTRPRGGDDLEDLRLESELAASEKDRAENLMIVDLVRNDLGRVCAPGSIEVPELMKIEAYAAVFQMVSTVTGTLEPGRDGLDLLTAAFPPGSMTGAPKIAAIELLDRLESVRRGAYAGALGYLDLRGGLDLSVVIRTFVWKDGQAHLHVGGGIVADSSPEAEYRESLDKARAPLDAIRELGGAVGEGQ
ncbi:MAG: aminodeoxychorismate synthase component I [Deltaproteobacteria bacterium]|jgi:para-aminobenzoate synthetase component 1|nr:aminodeoxychorismate synthase component I [Deltaproteobacteria bacterium]